MILLPVNPLMHPLLTLSDREAGVMQLMAKGISLADIAKPATIYCK